MKVETAINDLNDLEKQCNKIRELILIVNNPNEEIKEQVKTLYKLGFYKVELDDLFTVLSNAKHYLRDRLYNAEVNI